MNNEQWILLFRCRLLFDVWLELLRGGESDPFVVFPINLLTPVLCQSLLKLWLMYTLSLSLSFSLSLSLSHTHTHISLYFSYSNTLVVVCYWVFWLHKSHHWWVWKHAKSMFVNWAIANSSMLHIYHLNFPISWQTSGQRYFFKYFRQTSGL